MKDLNQRFKLKKASPEGTTGGDAGWMVDCKGAEISNLATLGHYLATVPSPWALVGGGLLPVKKNFSPNEERKILWIKEN